MLRLLVLSTLLVATASAMDRFQFFFRFTCQPSNPMITKWKHFILVEEYDLFDVNDFWYSHKWFYDANVGQNNTLVHFTVKSTKDQWLSAGYEPFLHIRHTCTNDGQIVPLVVWPSDLLPIGVAYTSVHVEYDLTNKHGETDPNNNYYQYDSTHLTHEQFEMR